MKIIVFAGPLLAHIQERIHFTEHEASLVIRDVANALKCLHQKGNYTKLFISILQVTSGLHGLSHTIDAGTDMMITIPTFIRIKCCKIDCTKTNL